MSGETAQVPGAVILTTVWKAPADLFAATQTPWSPMGNCVVCYLYRGRYISRLRLAVRGLQLQRSTSHDISTQTAIAFYGRQPRTSVGSGPFRRHRCKRLPCGEQDRSAPLPHPAAASAATTPSSAQATTGARTCSRTCTDSRANPGPATCARTSACSSARTYAGAMRRRHGHPRH